MKVYRPLLFLLLGLARYGNNGWRQSNYWDDCGPAGRGRSCDVGGNYTKCTKSSACNTGCCKEGLCLPKKVCGGMSAGLSWVLIAGVLCCGGCGVMAYLYMVKRKTNSNYQPVHAPPAVVYQPPMAVQQQGYPQQQPQTDYYGKQQRPVQIPTVNYPQHQPQMGYSQQAVYQQPQVYNQQAVSQQPQMPMMKLAAHEAPSAPAAPPPQVAVAIAEPAAPMMQTITVPPGYGPGKILKLKLDGKEHKIKIPEGKTPGTTFDINLALLPGGKAHEAPSAPAAPPPQAAVAMAEPAGPTMQTITVPPGYGPGKILKLKVDGKEHKIKIPQGKIPGTTFDINLALLPGGE